MRIKLNLLDEQQVAINLLWNLEKNNNPYEDSNIEKISDNMGDKEVPVTSIPSPFAQIHLFDSAFKFVNVKVRQAGDNQDKVISAIKGQTTYHRLISECLDVWEWLFNIDYFGSEGLTIVPWNEAVDLKLLKGLDQNGLNTFANSIELFINNYNQDNRFKGLTTVFSRFNIILLNNIPVAATSPYTGFFTTPNKITAELKRTDNSFLFKEKRPLYLRDVEFVKFLLKFLYSDERISNAYIHLFHYCIINAKLINDKASRPDLDAIINMPANQNLNNDFDTLSFGNTNFEILPGIVYRKKRKDDNGDKIVKNSDFKIRSQKVLKRPPMALIENCSKSSYTYIAGPLPDNFTIDSGLLGPSIEERFLPHSQQIQYPFITVDDVLTKDLIKLDYEINQQRFLLPKINAGLNYLLPIQENYFKYFTLDDLKQNLEMKFIESTKSVEVNLKMPVAGDRNSGYIEFSRIYGERSSEYEQKDITKGNIRSTNIYLGIYPFFKSNNNDYNDLYKIFLYHDAEKIKDARMEPFRYKAGNEIDSIDISNFVRTRKEDGQSYITRYYEMKKDLKQLNKDITFDFIKISLDFEQNRTINNIIIPKFQNISIDNNLNTKIAFDLGTSNTYIAYSIGSKIKSYSTMINDVQELVMLNKQTDGDFDIPHNSGLQPTQLNEFIPSYIEDNHNYKFPLKTVLNVSNHAHPDLDGDLRVFSNVNIPFALSKFSPRKKIDKIHSNLKWGILDPKRNDLRNMVKSFIEELMLLGRNLVLSVGGNPSKTTVLWFKPLSMSTGQVDKLEKYWYDNYINLFRKNNEDNNLHCITESWAPIYAQDRNFGVGDTYLNIDIGGGTTDIVAVDKDDNILLTTSFRFAGDNLFDNGIDNAQTLNGFVEYYQNEMKNYFVKQGRELDTKILEYMMSDNNLRSEDIVGYFFTIEHFKEQLKLDSKFKFLLLLHTTAIFYHTAQILFSKGCKKPLFIGLSGNGAKHFEILNGSKDLNKTNGLASVVNKIFNEIYNDDRKIELQIRDNPKESTSRGGLKGYDKIKTKAGQDIDKYVISLGDENTFYEYSKPADISPNRDLFKLKNGLPDQNVQKIVKNYQNFITLFFGTWWDDCHFIDKFLNESNPLSNKEEAEKYLSNEDTIKNVINTIIGRKRQEGDELLNETLFFYPLRAYLYDLSVKLYKNKI